MANLSAEELIQLMQKQDKENPVADPTAQKSNGASKPTADFNQSLNDAVGSGLSSVSDIIGKVAQTPGGQNPAMALGEGIGQTANPSGMASAGGGAAQVGSNMIQDPHLMIGALSGDLAQKHLDAAYANMAQQPDGAARLTAIATEGQKAKQQLAQNQQQTGVSTGDASGADTFSKTAKASGLDVNAADANLSNSDQNQMYSQADQDEREKAKADEAAARKLGDERKPKVGAWDYLAALAGVTTPAMAEATSFGQHRGGGYGGLGPAVTQLGMSSQLPLGTEQRAQLGQQAQFKQAELLGGAAQRGLETYKAGGENMFAPLRKMGYTNDMMQAGKDQYMGTKNTQGAQQASIEAAQNIGKKTVNTVKKNISDNQRATYNRVFAQTQSQEKALKAAKIGV